MLSNVPPEIAAEMASTRFLVLCYAELENRCRGAQCTASLFNVVLFTYTSPSRYGDFSHMFLLGVTAETSPVAGDTSAVSCPVRLAPDQIYH